MEYGVWGMERLTCMHVSIIQQISTGVCKQCTVDYLMYI